MISFDMARLSLRLWPEDTWIQNQAAQTEGAFPREGSFCLSLFFKSYWLTVVVKVSGAESVAAFSAK